MTRSSLLLVVTRYPRALFLAAILLGLAASSSGCATAPLRPQAPLKSGIHYAKLTRFASVTEFDGYLARVAEAQRRLQSRARRSYSPSSPADALSSPAPQAAPAPAAEASAKADSAGPAGESITNNQESGVDEGDIVKAAGDFLVILRRGRLFTVRQRESGRQVLAPVGRCDAYPPGASRGTWYDELLVYKDRVVVIGYSYHASATEIGIFRLHDDGQITHHATHFLRSNDYYSSRNYASRLVDGKLIFYMPYYLNVLAREHQLPSVATWQSGERKVGDWSGVLSKVNIYRPVQTTLNPTLHTVVQCDLTRRFDCDARAVLGPYARTFYVSRDAVYVWVSPGHEAAVEEGDGQTRKPARQYSYLYRLPILKGDVGALQVAGTPIDQFSFKEARGRINVLVSDGGGGDAMWAPERAGGSLALLRARLSDFSDTPKLIDASEYTLLPAVKGGSVQNRFVGDHLLWGGGTGWYGGGQAQGKVHVTHLDRPSAVSELSLEHGVDRIEAMAANAVVVGAGRDGLVFSAIDLRERPARRGTYLRRNASQGETRSHGFFFLPDGSGGGMLGLPVRLQGAPWRHLVEGSAEVTFLAVSSSLQFSPLGALGARAQGQRDDCVVSCVDWYGNARPIFFRGRVFALLGYELVEGSLENGRLQELQRIEFLQPGARTARSGFWF
jgi:hypothetical protein